MYYSHNSEIIISSFVAKVGILK